MEQVQTRAKCDCGAEIDFLFPIAIGDKPIIAGKEPEAFFACRKKDCKKLHHADGTPATDEDGNYIFYRHWNCIAIDPQGQIVGIQVAHPL